jgi:hypothetical protein
MEGEGMEGGITHITSSRPTNRTQKQTKMHTHTLTENGAEE